jgi:hypothetical protein
VDKFDGIPTHDSIFSGIISDFNSLFLKDPHFKTYDGTQYTYHGQCDLIMAQMRRLIKHEDAVTSHVSDTRNLSNLVARRTVDVHARTRIVPSGTWSLIQSIAIRFYDDHEIILEFNNDGKLYSNGILQEIFPFSINSDSSSSSYIAHVEKRIDQISSMKARNDGKNPAFLTKMYIFITIGNNDNGNIKIDGKKSSIVLSLFQSMIGIQMDESLMETNANEKILVSGMLGTVGYPGMITRDGIQTMLSKHQNMGIDYRVVNNTYGDLNKDIDDNVSVVTSAEDMGSSWQVNPELGDLQLFRTVQHPQYPEPCILPLQNAMRRRLLRALKENDNIILSHEESLAQDVARKACSHVVDRLMYNFCCEDVIQTGNIDIALGYGSERAGGF